MSNAVSQWVYRVTQCQQSRIDALSDVAQYFGLDESELLRSLSARGYSVYRT